MIGPTHTLHIMLIHINTHYKKINNGKIHMRSSILQILYLHLLKMFSDLSSQPKYIQYIPRNMHTVTALLCFVVVIHWLIFPYPSGLLHWHCGNLTIAPVPAKQPWWIWINISCEFIMNDCITTTKQSTTKSCAYFLGYTVWLWRWSRRSVVGVAPGPKYGIQWAEKWSTVGWKVAYVGLMYGQNATSDRYNT